MIELEGKCFPQKSHFIDKQFILTMKIEINVNSCNKGNVVSWSIWICGEYGNVS